jgi:hypothetical protein
VARPFRDRFKALANHLRETGQEDYASDVDAVLAPGGWALLRPKAGTSTTPSGSTQTSSNLPVYMGKELKNALEKAAEEIGVSLSAVAADGMQAVLDGRFVPPPGYTGPGDEKTNLNVRIANTLLDGVGERLAALSQEAGYRISKASVVTWWLADELGVDLESMKSAKAREKVPAKYKPAVPADAEMWTATRCAAFRGVSRQEWMDAVESGAEPEHVKVGPGRIPLWNADAVRGRKAE